MFFPPLYLSCVIVLTLSNSEILNNKTFLYDFRFCGLICMTLIFAEDNKRHNKCHDKKKKKIINRILKMLQYKKSHASITGIFWKRLWVGLKRKSRTLTFPDCLGTGLVLFTHLRAHIYIYIHNHALLMDKI